MSLSPCSVPGSRPTFQLAEDEFELGLGEDTSFAFFLPLFSWHGFISIHFMAGANCMSYAQLAGICRQGSELDMLLYYGAC